MALLALFVWPSLLLILIAAQCRLARRVVRAQAETDDSWSAVLAGSTMVAAMFAAGALWVWHMAQSTLDSALHVNRATTTITLAGIPLPVFAAIRLGEYTFLAMLIATGVGAAVYLDFQPLTRRLRIVETVLWWMSGVIFAGMATLLVLFARVPRW